MFVLLALTLPWTALCAQQCGISFSPRPQSTAKISEAMMNTGALSNLDSFTLSQSKALPSLLTKQQQTQLHARQAQTATFQTILEDKRGQNAMFKQLFEGKLTGIGNGAGMTPGQRTSITGLGKELEQALAKLAAATSEAGVTHKFSFGNFKMTPDGKVSEASKTA